MLPLMLMKTWHWFKLDIHLRPQSWKKSNLNPSADQVTRKVIEAHRCWINQTEKWNEH